MCGGSQCRFRYRSPLVSNLVEHTENESRKKKRKPEKSHQRLDCNALEKAEVRDSFKEVLQRSLTTSANNYTVSGIEPLSESLSKEIVSSLHKTANSVLPVINTKRRVLEIWRDDKTLNSLIDNRAQSQRSSQIYKSYTKKIKKRVRQLKNSKLQKEADELNDYDNRKQVEKLLRAMKDSSSTFKETKQKIQCDPGKLKEYFAKHFMDAEDRQEPT